MVTAAASHAVAGRGWSYRAFGLVIRSDIVLPDLYEVAGGDPPDVQVRYGPARTGPSRGVEAEPFIWTDEAETLIRTPAGRLLIAGGRVVEIDPAPGGGGAAFEPYLMGSALAVLCHQRGQLPLHASAVRVGSGAVAFVGASGAGKSTLAAGLSRAGFQVLCDDLCAVDFRSGEPVVRLGVTRLKLLPDSLERLGGGVRGLALVGTGGKFGLPTGEAGAAADDPPLPLRALYVLTTAQGDSGLRPLRGAEAVAEILAGVHRWPTARAMGRSHEVFAQAVDLARTRPVQAAPDPLDRATPSARLETIMASLAALV